MRALFVFVLLGAAACALGEEAQQAPPAPQVQHGGEKIIPGQVEHMKLVSVYGTANGLPQEAGGIKALFDGPLVVAFKMDDRDEVAAYYLNGLQSIYKNKGLSFLRDAVLHGEEIVALYLSAAHVLSIPEMKLPIRQVHLPQETSLEASFNYEKGLSVPWLFVVDKKTIPAASLKEQVEVGQVAFYASKVLLHRDFSARLHAPRQVLQRVLVPQQQPLQVLRALPLPLRRSPVFAPAHVLVRAQEPYLRSATSLQKKVVPIQYVLRTQEQPTAFLPHQSFPSRLPVDFAELSELSELSELPELSDLPREIQTASRPADDLA